LKRELEIKKGELEEQWHFSSLEKIFIENRIYRDIEEEETWEGVVSAIDKGLKPHVKHLKRAITVEDIARLTEIRIKRISKFDSFKADEAIRKLEEELANIQYKLDNLTEYAIDYFKDSESTFRSGQGAKNGNSHIRHHTSTKGYYCQQEALRRRRRRIYWLELEKSGICSRLFRNR
jgi:topoisomerase IV subunit A